MELWIRSQDRKLLEKAVMIKIAHLHNESIKEEDFTYSIIVNNDYVFADYKTKERALEVLDEIQKLFEPKIILKSIKEIAQTLDGVYYTNPDEYEIEQLSSYVYQMPEE